MSLRLPFWPLSAAVRRCPPLVRALKRVAGESMHQMRAVEMGAQIIPVRSAASTTRRLLLAGKPAHVVAPKDRERRFPQVFVNGFLTLSDGKREKSRSAVHRAATP